MMVAFLNFTDDLSYSAMIAKFLAFFLSNTEQFQSLPLQELFLFNMAGNQELDSFSKMRPNDLAHIPPHYYLNIALRTLTFFKQVCYHLPYLGKFVDNKII